MIVTIFYSMKISIGTEKSVEEEGFPAELSDVSAVALKL
jgi:hypothetical protein